MDISKYVPSFLKKPASRRKLSDNRLIRLAEEGNPEAQELLGEVAAKTAQTDEHWIEAVKWLDSAVRQGRNEARPKLNALIREIAWPLVAEGKRRSYELQQEIVNAKNRKPLQAPPGALDELPFMSAQQLVEFGSRYNDGDSVPVDFEVAFAAFLRAAELGVREAQYNTGLAYNVSKGVLGDPEKALEWLEKAAAQRYADAMMVMGVMYFRGEGVPVDTAVALRHLENAAQAGHPIAHKVAEAVRNGWEIS